MHFVTTKINKKNAKVSRRQQLNMNSEECSLSFELFPSTLRLNFYIFISIYLFPYFIKGTYGWLGDSFPKYGCVRGDDKFLLRRIEGIRGLHLKWGD